MAHPWSHHNECFVLLLCSVTRGNKKAREAKPFLLIKRFPSLETLHGACVLLKGIRSTRPRWNEMQQEETLLMSARTVNHAIDRILKVASSSPHCSDKYFSFHLITTKRISNDLRIRSIWMCEALSSSQLLPSHLIAVITIELSLIVLVDGLLWGFATCSKYNFQSSNWSFANLRGIHSNDC